MPLRIQRNKKTAEEDQLAEIVKQMDQIRKDMLKPQDVENVIGVGVKAGFESAAKDVHTLRRVRFEQMSSVLAV